MLPLYGKHFTQIPSLQPRLFLICNPICLIVKVLASFRFLFIRSSVASDPLIRSCPLYNAQSPCYMKILSQNCQPREPISCRVGSHEGLRAEFISALETPRPTLTLRVKSWGFPPTKLTNYFLHAHIKARK